MRLLAPLREGVITGVTHIETASRDLWQRRRYLRWLAAAISHSLFRWASALLVVAEGRWLSHLRTFAVCLTHAA